MQKEESLAPGFTPFFSKMDPNSDNLLQTLHRKPARSSCYPSLRIAFTLRF